MSEPIVPLTLMLDMPGFEVTAVTLSEGEWWLRVQLRPSLVACPMCGCVARLHDYDKHVVRDLPAFGRQTVLAWHKRRFVCVEAECGQKSWTETSDEIRPNMVLTERVRREMCRLVGQDQLPVSQVAEDFGVTWDTVDRAVREYGKPLVDDLSRLEGVEALGVDETLMLTATQRAPTKMVTGIVDITPGHKLRLLDVLDGRSSTPVIDWLDERPGTWLDQIKTCATDAARSYQKGLIDGGLGHAVFVLDHFHVIKLANECVDDVRRRTQRERTGHHGVRDNPLYGIRKLLLSNYERLPDVSIERINTAFSAGDPYGEVACAWTAKNLLRDVYAAPDERTANKKLFEFYCWCADVDVPEIITLATTIGNWQTEILNYWRTGGASNGPTECMNLLIEKFRRVGHGYRDFDRYRFRLLLSFGIDWDSVPWNTHRTARLRTHKPRLAA